MRKKKFHTKFHDKENLSIFQMAAYLEMVANHIRAESEAEQAIAAFVEPVELKPDILVNEEKMAADLGHWIHSQILPAPPTKRSKKEPKSSHGGENSQRRIKKDSVEGARRILTRKELNDVTLKYVKTKIEGEKTVFFCNSCQRRPSENRNLIFDHVHHNHLDLEMKCALCDKSFTSTMRFSHHNAMDHSGSSKKRARNRSENPIKEIHGSVKLFGNSPPVDPPPQPEHPERTIPCNDCEKMFEHERGLTLHKATKHRKIDPITAKNVLLSNSTEPQKNEGRQNKKLLTKVHVEGSLAPPDGLLSAEIEKYVSVITSITKKEKVFVCCICTHEFRQKANLKHHIEGHLNYTHKCTSCDFSSTSSQMMSSHKKTMHASIKAYIRPIAWFEPQQTRE